jgi:hypothetical protein
MILHNSKHLKHQTQTRLDARLRQGEEKSKWMDVTMNQALEK